MALLLCRSNELPVACMIQILAEKTMDGACTYAWKAVASFRGRSATDSNPSLTTDVLLRAFHDEVGPVLDALQENGGESLAYAEYCAYRALHLGSNHPDVKYLCQGSREFINDQPRSIGSAAFDLLLLALRLCRALDSSVSKDERLDDAQLIMEQFAVTVLESNDQASLTRCYKLLALATLPRNIYNLSKDSSWESSPMDCSMMYCAARILANCLSPLCMKLLSNKSQTKADIHRFWEATVESFIRALTALTRISTANPKALDERSISPVDVNAEANSIAINLVNLLTQRQAPTDCLEKAAKVSEISVSRSKKHLPATLECLPSIFDLWWIFRPSRSSANAF